MTDIQTYERLKDVKLYLVVNTVLILMVIALPALAYHGFQKPTLESSNIWFQRSGALMTMICIVIDLIVYKVSTILNPPLGDKFFDIAKRSHVFVHRILAGAAATLTVLATIIWGYGDLAINA